MAKRFLFFVIGLLLYQLHAHAQPNPVEEKLIHEGVANFNSRHFTEALKSFDKLITIDSTNYLSWAFRGRTLEILNKHEEALASFNKALSINPEYYDGYGYRGTFFALNHRPDLALQDVNKALDGKKNDSTLLQLRAGYLLKLAQFDSAIADCNFLLQLNPKNASAYCFRASAYKSKGLTDLALTDLNRAIEINPGDPLAYNDRGFVFIRLEKYDLAISDFKKSISLAGPDDSTAKAFAYNNLAFALYKNGQFEKALENVNQSLLLLPTNSYAYKNRGLIFFALNNNADACKDLETSLKLGFTEKYGNEVSKLQSEKCK